MLVFNAPLTADDFFTGLFAALAAKNKKTISLRGNLFDAAMVKVYEALKREAAEQGLKIGFRIQSHPLHQDSTTVRDGITSAARRDIISLDNPIYQDIRLKIASTDSNAYLSSLTGSPEMYMRLADVLTQEYPLGVR